MRRAPARLATAVALLAAASAFGACASMRLAGESPADYADYRRYRLAPTFEERLTSGWIYLRDRPDGEHRVEVMRWFGPAEARFYQEAGRTPGGAMAYLDLLPDGPHAEDEATWLRGFEKDQREAPRRAQKALEEARARAEAARRAAGEAIETWTKRAVAIKSWGLERSRFEAIDVGFAEPLLHEAPAAKCGDEACVKTSYFTYAIPDASPAEDRIVPVVVALGLSDGRVISVAIDAPKGGFTWWLEGAEARAIDPYDTATRQEAVVRAKNRIETIVRAALGDGCVTSEAPALRTIDCGRVKVTIQVTPNGDDVVRIVGVPDVAATPPAPSSSAPSATP